MRICRVVISLFLITPAFAAAPAPKQAQSEVNRLFSQLSKTQSDEEAKPIEEKIMVAFLRSGSPTVDLLMTRAAAAAQAEDDDLARKLVSAVTSVAPDYAEGWHQRAILQANAGDDQGAMFCLEKAVTLNPRNFEALAELAGKIEEYGDKPGALRLYRRALKLDPYFDGVARKVRVLVKEVEGESL
jgi:Flp pilus assembly protein TadD